MSYLEGVRTGYDLTKDLISGGVEEYEKGRSYRDALQAKSDAAGNAAYSDAQDRDLKHREFEERVRHDKAVEGEWAPGSRGGHGGAGMSDSARKSIARGKIIANHTRNLIAGVEETPEDLAAYHSAINDEHDYLHPGDPLPKNDADADKKPVKDEGFHFDSLFKVPLENAEKFFKEHSVPAPAAKTMTGTLNGKRVTLTKTAAGWTDESGQVVK